MMFSVKSTVKLDFGKLDALDSNAVAALEMTADALHTEIANAQVVPFKDGALHEEAFHADKDESEKGVVFLSHSTPYARRMYYHPEYNFHRAVWHDKDGTHGANSNAQGKWLRFWLPGGTRQNFCQEKFKEIYKGLCGL